MSYPSRDEILSYS